MKTTIPTSIINEILSYINIETDFNDISPKQTQKLIKTLIELWLFIYTKQTEDDTTTNLKGFTNIDKKELTKFNIQLLGIRLQYPDLIDILDRCDLIKINHKYNVGKFYKSYRIETSFISTNYTQVDIDFQKVFSNTQSKKYWLERYTKYSNLIEDCYNTKIDMDQYIKWLINNEGIELKPILVDGRLTKRFLTKERIYLHINLALKINFQNIWFKISDEGRFYSSISNLPYTAVDFILLYGNKTSEIDIKNSQPLLLSLLVDNKTYSEDVRLGIFYKKVADDLKIKDKEFKILSFKYIFFNPKPLKSGKVYDSMKKLYGSLIDDINIIKEDGRLSHRLQKMESDIFVKKIGKLKMNKLIRHDQVIIKEGDYNIMKNYLENEYRKLGIEVIIKQK